MEYTLRQLAGGGSYTLAIRICQDQTDLEFEKALRRGNKIISDKTNLIESVEVGWPSNSRDILETAINRGLLGFLMLHKHENVAEALYRSVYEYGTHQHMQNTIDMSMTKCVDAFQNAPGNFNTTKKAGPRQL